MSQTVARAIEILEFVAREPRTQSEVGARLGVHRSTALRILESLTDGGLARRLPDGRYAIGLRLAGLARLAEEQFGLTDVARAHLRGLGARTGHTVHLAALEGDRIVYADKIDPADGIRLYAEIGRPVTLHTAGVAKAILAELPPDRAAALLDASCDFAPHTATTVTDPAAYRAVLARTRERGHAVDDGEYEDYVNCLAAPVRGSGGEVVGAVSVTALKARADLAALTADVLPDLLTTVATISEELGWRPRPLT
ncbi:helix-turn-helix domain-containing protein [Streptomyces sp. SID5785]|uniref:IclR family transcriptional regulator n=1 Tax=Streptomyces sp. SID5785 TaxID=2690309 RepID=UPI001361C84C|nr:IclR family transcriptional regulator [Streptomyces sp. SID5785]MZD05308.1 helix-turn-helix domain-containing protein [Streptomyces sp. SID5785]